MNNDKAQHTALPWKAEFHFKRGNRIVSIQEKKVICLTSNTDNYADGIDDANTSLIVRAVNFHDPLLKAANHFKDCWKRHLENFIGCKQCDESEIAVEEAK